MPHVMLVRMAESTLALRKFIHIVSFCIHNNLLVQLRANSEEVRYERKNS